MQIAFRLAVVLLLVGMLMVQILILRRMPLPVPSLAALQAATPDQRKKILLQRPLAMIDGSVTIEGTVDVSVENTPLEVEIIR